MALRQFLETLNEREKRLLVLAAAIVVIALGFELITGGLFLTPRNIYNLAVQSSVVAIMSIGMVLVIATRNIDLSVGSILGLTGMIVALLQIRVFPADAAWNWPLTVLIGLLAGGLIGAWQGFLVAFIRIPSFVVTLAGLLIFRGATFEVAQGATLSPFQEGYRMFGGGPTGSLGEAGSWWLFFACLVVAALALAMRRRAQRGLPEGARHSWLAFGCAWVGALAVLAALIATVNAYALPGSESGHGIPGPLLILGALAAIGIFVMLKVPIGRHILAVGRDINAAHLVGVPTRMVVVKVFTLMGLLCAVGAIVMTSRLNAGTTNLGTLMELNVIAAAVIGGASLDGGRGSILGGVLGAIVIQSLDTGLVLVGTTSSMRQILIGFVLIGAVWFDRLAYR